MKLLLSTLILIIFHINVTAQSVEEFIYEPSQEFPFGRLNPNAPKAVADFDELIGRCLCESITRNSDGEWAEPAPMIWTFKYIMNGTGVQDETLKPSGVHAGSIRQYNPDSSRWYVHYYSSGQATETLQSWEGNKEANGDIILYNEQKAPNGMDGYYKIVFSNISKEGFDWLGEWVDPQETIHYPLWKISCKKESD